MSSFSSLYVVPQDSYDKYLKLQKSTSKGVFPSAKTIKVQQLNINEAENINNNSGGSEDKKRGEKRSGSGDEQPSLSVTNDLQRDLEEVTEHLNQVREREEARGNLLNRDVNVAGAENVNTEDNSRTCLLYTSDAADE